MYGFRCIVYYEREDNMHLIWKFYSTSMPCKVTWIAINAGIVNFKFKDFNAAVEDLSACVKLDKDNKSAYTYLVRA